MMRFLPLMFMLSFLDIFLFSFFFFLLVFFPFCSYYFTDNSQGGSSLLHNISNHSSRSDLNGNTIERRIEMIQEETKNLFPSRQLRTIYIMTHLSSLVVHKTGHYLNYFFESVFLH